MPFNFPPFPPPPPREAAMAWSCFSSRHLLTEHQATARWAGGGVPTLTFWKTFSLWGGEERTVTRFVIFSSLATKNPGLSTRWGGRGGRGSGAGRLQTPIKVFYWISTSGSRRQGGPGAGAGAAGDPDKIQYHKHLANTPRAEILCNIFPLPPTTNFVADSDSEPGSSCSLRWQ